MARARMRPDDTAGALSRVLIACLLSLAIAGCSLRSPGCGNRDVKASLEKEARASAEQWMSTTSSESLLPADAQFVVSGSFETSRTENTRECSATMKVGSRDNQVSVPIVYQVIAADDGQVLYRWDEAAFGKSFIANAILSGVSKAIKPLAAPLPAEGSTDQAPTPEPDTMEAWQKSVRATVFARAKQLTDMPSGVQSVRFRVGGDGEVTNVTAVGDAQNAELTDKTIRFLETMGPAPIPPDHKSKWVEVALRF